MTMETATEPNLPSAPPVQVLADSWRGSREERPEADITRAVWGGSSMLAGLEFAIQVSASDVHLAVGQHPWIRRGRRFEPNPDLPVTTEGEMELIAQLFRTLAHDETDLSVAITTGEYRWRFLIMFTDQGWAATFRSIRSEPPVVAQLGLPQEVSRFANWHDGLVIVAGGTGSGKSTTVAAILSRLINARSTHLLTIENPIEYQFSTGTSLVRQQQIPEEGLVQALAMALRSDPDVVFFGECIRKEHFEGCMQLASTGHLVFTTLHARDMMTVCERIVSSCGVEGRSILANTLRAVISQQLLPSATDISVRHLAAEVVTMNRAMRNHIAPDGNLKMLRQEVQTKNKDMDHTLASLAAAGKIDIRDAEESALDPERFSKCCERFGINMDEHER